MSSDATPPRAIGPATLRPQAHPRPAGLYWVALMVVGAVLLPTLALTALLSPPVLLVARRLLGAPRVVEPYGLSA